MHCLDCGYDLRNLSEHRCPECGRGFDPRQDTTWGKLSTPRLRKARVLAGWACALIAFCVPVYVGWGIARGHDDFMALILYWMIGILPFILALVIWVGCLTVSQIAPSRRAIVVAVVLLLFNVSLITEWPMHASFALHRNTLNRQVQQAHQGQLPAGSLRIGIYLASTFGIKTMPTGQQVIIIQIGGGSGPDFLVHGMTDQEIETNFNSWSYRRLDQQWHIVHED